MASLGTQTHILCSDPKHCVHESYALPTELYRLVRTALEKWDLIYLCDALKQAKHQLTTLFIIDFVKHPTESCGDLHLHKSAYHLRIVLYLFARKKGFICAQDLLSNAYGYLSRYPMLNVVAPCPPRGPGSNILSRIIF